MANDPKSVVPGLLAASDASIGSQSAALASFEAGLKKTVAGMRGRLIDLLGSGALDPAKAAKASALLALQSELSKQLNAEGYPELVKKLIGSYDASIESAIAAVKAMKLPDERLAPLDRNALKQLKNVDYDYLQSIGQDAVNAVARTVISSTVGGAISRAKLIDSIAATLDTKLKGYASTYADTALVTYDRTVSMQVWQAAGIQKFLFRGPRDIKNRPLCAKYADTVHTLAAIKKLDAEAAKLSSAPLLPVQRFGGGWNCRHVWSPWPEDVPAPAQPAEGEKKPQSKAKSANQKPEWTLKDASPKMGGAHAKEIWTDAAGSDWLFKPVGADKKIIPYAEEAASKVAALVNPQTAIEVKTVTLGGKFGSVQKLLPDIAGDLTAGKYNVPVPMESLTPHQVQQLQREHVVDWLISNHDGHPGNFLTTKSGALYGIDKAQAFKHLGNDSLSTGYHPNKAYGEQEPIYNTLGKAIKAGKVAFNPADTLPAIEAVDKISDADFLKAIEGYAANHPSGDPEKFKQLALARKNSVRADFTGYYREVTGDKHFDFDPAKMAAAKKAEADAIAAAKKKVEEEAAAKAKAEAEAKAKALAEIEKLKAEIAAKKAKALAAYELQLTTGKKPGKEDAHVLGAMKPADLDPVKAKVEAAEAKAKAEAEAAAQKAAQETAAAAKKKALQAYNDYLSEGKLIDPDDDAVLATIPEADLKAAEAAHEAKKAAEAAAAKAAAEAATAAALKAQAESLKVSDEEAKRLARNAYNRARRAKKKGGSAEPETEPDQPETGEFKHLDARNAAYVETAKAAGWQGKSLAIDKDQIEDQNVLVWQEQTKGGERTVLRMKIRPEAQSDVLRAFGAEAGATVTAAGKTPGGAAAAAFKADADLVPIPTAPVSKQLFNNLVNGIIGPDLPDTSPTWKFGWGGQMSVEQVQTLKKEYAGWKAAVAAKRDELKRQQEAAAKKAGKPAATGAPFEVSRTAVVTDQKEIDRGIVRVIQEDVPLASIYSDTGTVQQFNAAWPDGIRARFVPWQHGDGLGVKLSHGSREREAGYAFQGSLELIVPESASPGAVDRALARLSELGVKSGAATKTDEEILYLRKAAYVAKAHLTPEWKKVAAAKATDEERLVLMRQYWNRRLGVDDVTKLPDYKPQGEHTMRWDKPGERAGYRLHHRFDLTEKDLEAQMRGYRIVHDPRYGGGTIEGLLEAALPSNATLAATTEKARTGITRKGAASAASDITTGGAGYAFTRIAKPGARKTQIYWKLRVLRRMDAISYDGDRYGRTTSKYVERDRASTPDEFKRYAENVGSNETVFKSGLHLLEDLDEIKTDDAHHRGQVLAIFKKHGVTKLPDGRTIEQVVK